MSLLQQQEQAGQSPGIQITNTNAFRPYSKMTNRTNIYGAAADCVQNSLSKHVTAQEAYNYTCNNLSLDT